MFPYAALTALVAGSLLVSADPNPTAPGPGDIFKEGEQCTFTWDVDATGTWKEMNVELMSGSNLQMNHITTVATVDATDASKTTFTYDCPQVTPNSAIYFYQFTTPSAPTNILWTTRFTIAAADGTTTPPENADQPNSADPSNPIPWGTGALVDPSAAVAAPSYIGSGSTGSTGTTGTTAAADTTAAAATTALPAASSSTTKSGFSVAPAPSSTANPGSAAGLQNATTAGNATGGADNGALAFGVDSYVARAGLALGVAAFTFAVAL